MFSLFSTLTLVGVMLAVRTCIVNDARMREIHAAGKRAREAAAAGDPNWRRHWDAFDRGPSHTRMLLQLHKWTHAQFYPGSEA